jgi:hypothetical protein
MISNIEMDSMPVGDLLKITAYITNAHPGIQPDVIGPHRELLTPYRKIGF